MRKLVVAAIAALALSACEKEKTEEEKMAEALGYTPEQVQRLQGGTKEQQRELLEKKKQADQDAEALQAVGVGNISLEPESGGFGSYSGEVEISNGLDFALSNMSLRLQAKSPGRAVPWNEGDEYIRIPGGIEPGETRTVSVYLNSTNGWQLSEYPADTEFKATVIRVSGPDGETVYDADPFSMFEEVQLKSME